MFCSACGQSVREDAHFCERCGAQFQEESEIAPGETVPYGQDGQVEAGVSTEPALTTIKPRRRSVGDPYSVKDPYKEQIAEIRLHIKQLKLELKQIATDMANTRAHYNQTSAFIPHGILHKGYKLFEDARLLGPQQQKQQLQQEILRLEQELLDLQQAQLDWKEQQH